jgi:hypothetical protein
MIHPEVGEHFFELSLAVDRAQDLGLLHFRQRLLIVPLHAQLFRRHRALG